MSDWQVGDLAVCVDASRRFGSRNPPLSRGRTYTVRGFARITGGLLLEEVNAENERIGAGWKMDRFRKIRPDEPTACEEEFKTLLDLSRKVRTFDEEVEALRRDHAEYRARLEDTVLRSLERRPYLKEELDG